MVHNSIYRRFVILSLLHLLICNVGGYAQESLFSGIGMSSDKGMKDDAMLYTETIFDINNNVWINDRIILEDAKLMQRDGETLKFVFGHEKPVQSMTLPLTKNVDLNNFISIAFDIKNETDRQLAIEAQCIAEKDTTLTIEDGTIFYYRNMLILEPGETDTMLIYLSRSMDTRPEVLKNNFIGMYGVPGGL